MKILQTFIIVMLLATQSGCMSLIALCNYADSRIPRKVRPEPGYYEATIQYEDHATIRKIASSAESVGELRLRKCPKIVIESDFQRWESA
jgi:hypothetical protein